MSNTLRVGAFVCAFSAAACSGGSDRSSGVLSTSQTNRKPGTVFIDDSNHQTGFASLDHVTLHFLDWGGQGPFVLLVHGLGDTAHVFDDLAPRLADRFHVVSVTLRGHGQSDRPPGGYDTSTLVEDVRQFLDRLDQRMAILVGHSIATDVLTMFAARYPERVSKLVYLEEASDAAELPELDRFTIIPEEMLRKSNRRDYLGTTAVAMGAEGWNRAMEANLHSAEAVGKTGLVEDVTTPEITTAFIRGKADPDHKRIKAPTLALFAHGYVWSSVPAAQREDLLGVWNRNRERHMQRFRMLVPGSRVIALEGAGHYLFIQRREDVIRLVREFIGN